MDVFKYYLWCILAIAIVCSALLAHTCLPLIGILGGFVASMVISRFSLKKFWNESDLAPWKKWCLAGIAALIGSQMGWVALLI